MYNKNRRFRFNTDAILDNAELKNSELENFSNKLKELIEESELSIPDLCKKINISEVSIRRLLSKNSNYNPSINFLYQLSYLANSTMSDMLSEKFPLFLDKFDSVLSFATKKPTKVIKILGSIGLKQLAMVTEIVLIEYINNVTGIFQVTNNIESISSTIGCIIQLNKPANKFIYGHIRKNAKNTFIFCDYTNLDHFDLSTNDFKLIAIQLND